MLEQPVEHGHVRQNITSRAQDPVTLLQQLSFYHHLREGNKKIKKKRYTIFKRNIFLQGMDLQRD